MTENNDLFVRSHVARDLLQAAGLFKTDKLVVWEYVSNGLQYVDPGTSPHVTVSLDSKGHRLSVLDNGRGMDWGGLQNFFVMHGENVDRKEGRPGRGMFGTGKSAALGIGDTLRITTTQAGRRCKVELRRSDVESMGSEDPIPVRVIERETLTSAQSGTLVEVEGIHLKSLDQPGIIHYVERHLARWPRDVTVYVNNHECEFTEPPVDRELLFHPEEGPLRDQLGDVELSLKVARAPLDEDIRGVSIFANGVWHETTLAGSDGREMSQYIFGDLDVPALDSYVGPIGPFDMSRSMRLNPNNEIVQAIYAFTGRHVEEVRHELVEADRQRRAGETARRLQVEADKIADVINSDFDDFRQRLARAKARASGGGDLVAASRGSKEGEDLLGGGSESGSIIADQGSPGKVDGGKKRGSGPPPDLLPLLEKDDSGPERGRPGGGDESRGSTSRGGFRVHFAPLGAAEYRGKYVRDERTIYINLDHPQIVAAKGSGSDEDPSFRRLAYEVAFAEYAVALASELAARDEYLDPSDPIVDIRDTLNRVATRGAALYSAT
jgi:hypothetical protein